MNKNFKIRKKMNFQILNFLLLTLLSVNLTNACFSACIKELSRCNKGAKFSCQNGGTCKDGGLCVCRPGFSGFLCENCKIYYTII
jgi:hypothetical protein